MAPIPDYSHVTHSWQSSIGIAQQFGTTTALQVDYVQTNSRNEKSIQDNVNVTFNPATGVPYPYSDVAHRAYPMFGVVGSSPHTGKSDYYGVQSSLTKRMSNHWQANVTYTLGWFYSQDPPPSQVCTRTPERCRSTWATSDRCQRLISDIARCSTASGMSRTGSR